MKSQRFLHTSQDVNVTDTMTRNQSKQAITRNGNSSVFTVLFIGFTAMVISGTHDFWDDGNGGGIRGGTVTALQKQFDPKAIGPTGNHGPGDIPRLTPNTNSNSYRPPNRPATNNPLPEVYPKSPDGPFVCGNGPFGPPGSGPDGEVDPGVGKDPNQNKHKVIVIHGTNHGEHGDYENAAEALAKSLSATRATILNLPDISQTKELIINAVGGPDKDNPQEPFIEFQFPDASLNVIMSPDDFVVFLKEKHFNGSLIHFVACNSATDYGNGSFIHQVYDKLGNRISIRGYPHLVRVHPGTGQIFKKDFDFLGYDITLPKAPVTLYKKDVPQ